MVSKTKIKSRVSRKTNPEVVGTLKQGNKNPEWNKIISILSGPANNYSSINLQEIEDSKDISTGDIVLIPGKVLSKGELSKKLKIVALSISESAKEKLSNSKSEFSTILEEIKSNPKAEGIKILR
jgi:large subunit ribosomal protein L18e